MIDQDEGKTEKQDFTSIFGELPQRNFDPDQPTTKVVQNFIATP